MDIGTDNLIALLNLIALILLTGSSLWISNKALKNNYHNEQNRIFCEMVKGEREIAEKINTYKERFNETKNRRKKTEILIESDKELFDFYEHLAILLIKNFLDWEIFLNYFELKIFNVYDTFMESLMFEAFKDRFYMYKNLSTLFNLMNLSIREKGTIK